MDGDGIVTDKDRVAVGSALPTRQYNLNGNMSYRSFDMSINFNGVSDNHDNKELIFAVDQRFDLNGHNRMSYFSLSGDQFPLPAFPNANGPDGPGITPNFFLDKGIGTYQFGKDTITFGNGTMSHRRVKSIDGEIYTSHFGSLRTQGIHVYLTGKTPFRHTLTVS